MSEPVLEVKGLNAFYGRAHVLQDVNFVVTDKPVAIIGRNGMGKSTLCQSIMGMLSSSKGSVRFRGQELMGKPSYRIAQLGLGFVPQGRCNFPAMSVTENLKMGCYTLPASKHAVAIERVMTSLSLIHI